MMLKRLIKWIRSCFSGSAAVSRKSKAGYDIRMADLSWYGTFEHILDSGPHYIVSGVFLLLTLLVEMPIVYNVLKSNVQDNRKMQLTIIVSNVITTAGVAIIERLITEGCW